MSEPISPPPPSPPPPGAPPPAPNAGQQVQGPSIGLIVTAVIGILFAVWNLLSTLLGIGLSMPNLSELGEYGPAARYWGYAWGGLGAVGAIIKLGVSGFIIWAALQMKELRQWTLAVVASILAMVPCFGPCCLIGIPIGIWALVVLMKPEVKAAFSQ